MVTLRRTPKKKLFRIYPALILSALLLVLFATALSFFFLITSTTTKQSGTRTLRRKEKKVAYCIRGEYRDLGNLQTLKEFIADPLDADIFLAMQGTRMDQVRHLEPVHFDFNDYSYDDIYKMLIKEGMDADLWRAKVNTTLNSLAPFLTWRQSKGGSAIFQYFSMKRCDELIEEYEKRHNLKYDWVVMTRSDGYCLGEPFCLSDDNAEDVYVPWDNMDFYGISDRMIAIRRSYSTQVLRKSWVDLTQNKNFFQYTHNTEVVLKLGIKDALGIEYDYGDPKEETFQHENIERVGRPLNVCFIACNPNTHSNWGSCRENEFEANNTVSYQGYKYWQEYEMAHDNRNSTEYLPCKL